VQDHSDRRDEDQRGSDTGFRRDGEERQAIEQALYDRAAAEGAQSEDAANALRQEGANGDVVRQAADTVAIEGATAMPNPVAGTAMETTTGTGVAGTPTPPAASEAISVQTEWLARNGGGTARILLSPPSLGEVAIQVTLRGGDVNVVMIVNEVAAQSVAEDQANRLAQAFSNHDLRMDNFEVRQGNPQDIANGDFKQFGESESRDEGRAGDNEATRRNAESSSPDGSTEGEESDQSGQPQIISAGPEASVDLRI